MIRKKATPVSAPAIIGRESYVIQLAGQPYPVPPLPFRCNREAYPLCLQLAESEIIKDFIATGEVKLTFEDFHDFGKVAFLGASAGQPDLTREAFDALPITPMELIDAFLIVRLATGGWVRAATAVA